MGEILRVDNISKSFPGVQALSKINTFFSEGEICALVGENGAGKSTLVYILMGAIRPDKGKVFVKGNEVDITGVHKAKGYGIGAVFQDPSLINHMSVAENIFLGEQGKFRNNGILSYSKIFKAAEQILNDLKVEIDVRQLAVLLSPAQRKLIEFAKMMRDDPKVIILDEITAALDYESVDKLNLDIAKGEIVALAGLRGHGQSELLKAVFGLVPKNSGKIFINNKEVIVSNPVKAKMKNIAFISNRREDELCFTHSIRRNIALSSLSKRQKGGFIMQGKEKQEVSDISVKMNIIAPSMTTEVNNLSGGNKQKVIFSKWLLTLPDLLLCDEPAEGLDMGAKSEVYHILRRLANEGKSILLVLSDMIEILNLPDRVVVLREGKIVKEFSIIGSEESEILEKEILKASIGVT